MPQSIRPWREVGRRRSVYRHRTALSRSDLNQAPVSPRSLT
jgi:hypothetical protein